MSTNEHKVRAPCGRDARMACATLACAHFYYLCVYMRVCLMAVEEAACARRRACDGDARDKLQEALRDLQDERQGLRRRQGTSTASAMLHFHN